jgi:hypothetical protein
MDSQFEMMLRWCWWFLVAGGLFGFTFGSRFVSKAGFAEEVRGRQKLVRVCGILMLICGIGALLLNPRK